MKCFDDPDWRAETLEGLKAYMETGIMPLSWTIGASLRKPHYERKRIYWRDWELRTLVEVLLTHGRYFTKHLPSEFQRNPREVRRKLVSEGGRSAFIAKYRVLLKSKG